MHPPRGEFAVLAESLEPLLQEEHPHQVPGRRRTEDRRHLLFRGERVAIVIPPGIDDRVGCGIVLGPRLCGDLLARLVRHDVPERAVHELLHEGQRTGRATRSHEQAGCIFHHPRRHAFVGHTESLGLPGVHALAGEHEVERRRRADELGQAFHAAPAGYDAEHDFRQGKLRRGLVDHHAIAAGQRELEAAAETMTADQRQRGVGHRGQAVEAIPAAFDQRPRTRGGVERGEFLDVGARDEASRLGRGDDEPFRPRLLEGDQDALELGQRLGRQRIGDGIGLVEPQPRQAVGAALDAPVLVGISHSLAPARSASPRPARRRCRCWRCHAGRSRGAVH